ncbi:MAG: hypothetical protein J6A70_04960 [Prevotella sp.]|nr:hypothetical protein [Prevotella sp.]
MLLACGGEGGVNVFFMVFCRCCTEIISIFVKRTTAGCFVRLGLGQKSRQTSAVPMRKINADAIGCRQFLSCRSAFPVDGVRTDEDIK